jgi:hypothetical protein
MRNKSNSNESIFPMDSFSKPFRKKKVLYTVYPENKQITTMPRRAMIDLDGTIHKYSQGYSDGSIYDDPFEGAREVINWLKSQGYEIVIFTTRASKQNAVEMGGDASEEIYKVADWLNKNDIYFDRITAEKLAADFYIDDKAISIEDGDWNSVFDAIQRRVKYKV